MYYLALYIVACSFCFFVGYCSSVYLKGRLHAVNTQAGLFQFYTKVFQAGLPLMWHDYGEVHCPWSWQVAKRHRLHDLRAELGDTGLVHELLGRIVAADCDKVHMQEAIAQYTYSSRCAFWIKGLSNLFIPVSSLYYSLKLLQQRLA